MAENELDADIAREEAKVRRLRAELAGSKAKLRVLLEDRRVTMGERLPSKSKPSIADAVEDILRENKAPMHMNRLVQSLADRGIAAAKGTVTTAIARYVAQGRRFERVEPNTFGLKKEKGRKR
jgi:hypothetical protein